MSMQGKENGPILVTGATSAIGARLCARLVEGGHEVRALVTGTRWHALPAGVEPYFADLTMPGGSGAATVKEACDGVGTIFHMASATFNHRFTFDQFISINVVGTENLIKAALAARPEVGLRMVFTSSVTVYGYRRPGEVITEDTATRPKSDYSRSKLMAEQVVGSYAKSYDRFTFTTLRLGTLYGLGYDEPSFSKVFRMIRDGSMRYIGSPSNHLTLLHVDDAVDAQMAAAAAAGSNRVYNVTDGVAHTEKELFELVAKFFGTAAPDKTVGIVTARIAAKLQGVNSDELEFLASDRVISIDRARRELGFEPKRRVEVEGMEMLKRFAERYHAGTGASVG